MFRKKTAMFLPVFIASYLFVVVNSSLVFAQPGAHEPQIGGMMGQHGFVSIIATQDWPWGERYYEDEFEIKLLVSNDCDTSEQIRLSVTAIPYLTMPTQAVIPGKVKDYPIKGKVKLPPTPPPPLRTGAPDEPGYGWVEPEPIPPQPFSLFPIPPFHQPNFGTIAGSVMVTHLATRRGDVECMENQKIYQASGHIHFRPPEPPPQSQLFSADVCLVYWNLGEPPAQLGDTDCTYKMRGYADDFLKRVVGPYAANDPDRWEWLSMVSDLNNMNIPQLLAFKEQASSVMGGGEVVSGGSASSEAASQLPGFGAPNPIATSNAKSSVNKNAAKLSGKAATKRSAGAAEKWQTPLAGAGAGAGCSEAWGDNSVASDTAEAVDKVCLKQMREAAKVIRDQVAQPKANVPKALLPSDSRIKKMSAEALKQYRRDAAAYAKADAIERSQDAEASTNEVERAARSPCDNLWFAPNSADAASLAACEPSFREQATQARDLWRAAALAHPKDWQWLPSEKALGEMSGAQLFSVKQKADIQMNKGSW